MKTTVRTVVLAVLAVPLLVACAPPWQVVRQTAPNPFVNQRAFLVEAVRFDNLMVGGKPDAVYTSQKTPEQQASWAGDKGGMNQEFAQSLIASGEGLSIVAAPAPPPPGAFVIRTFVTFIEPGVYAYVMRVNTEVNVTVQLLEPSGQTVLDEFATRAFVEASIFNPATGSRERSAMKHIGNIVARYIRARVFPQQ